MNPELYKILLSALPFIAILISLISLGLSIRNRSDQRQVLLQGKKTELITKRAQRLATLETLVQVYSYEKDRVLKSIGSSTSAPDDLQRLNLQRVDSGLANSIEAKLVCEEHLSKAHKMTVRDLAIIEEELATENDYLAGAKAQLDREQDSLKLLGP